MKDYNQLTYNEKKQIANQFIKTRATIEDIDELEDLIEIRKKSLVDFTCGDGNLE